MSQKSEHISNICKRVCGVLVNNYPEMQFSDVSVFKEDIDELLKMIFGYDNITVSKIRRVKNEREIYKDIIIYLTDYMETKINFVSSHILKDVFISESISYMRLVKLKEIIN